MRGNPENESNQAGGDPNTRALIDAAVEGSTCGNQANTPVASNILTAAFLGKNRPSAYWRKSNMYEKYITTPAWKLGREMNFVSPVALVVRDGKCSVGWCLCVGGRGVARISGRRNVYPTS